jgi:hypothetical protein
MSDIAIFRQPSRFPEREQIAADFTRGSNRPHFQELP